MKKAAFCRLNGILCFLVFTLLYPQSAKSIEIHEIRWGFSDVPVANKINPVTILVENSNPVPFEGEIRFQQETFRGQQIDITLSATTFIAPFEKKWIQYYPYISESANNWRASWTNQSGPQAQLFLAPRTTNRNVTIQLVPPNDISRVLPGIKHFPEELFPPFSGAVDSLNRVLLDHVPRWEKSRRKTFLQWIYSGGIVHLFENSNGELPAFSESYAPLNQTTSPIQYGDGVIYRHQNQLKDISTQELNKLIKAKHQFAGSQHAKSAERNISEPLSEFSNREPHTNDERVLVALTEISKPKLIWYFIFFLSFIYLIVAGPGYYFITKISQHHYIFYAVYLSVTVLFCIIFLVIGRYSANRNSQIHSLMIAKFLPENEIDITEWSCLGIASGGDFQISHSGDSHIYSTCQQYSKVNGVVTCGTEGMIQVDIPTNSSRTFFHRTKTSNTLFGVKLHSFLANDMGLETLSLEIDQRFPTQVDQVHFLYRAKLYELRKENNQLTYQGTSRNLSSILDANPLLNQFHMSPGGGIPFAKPQGQQNDVALNHFFSFLLQRTLKLSSREQYRQFQLSENRGKLLVFCPIPDALFPESPIISQKEGMVLYCLDVPLTGQAD